MAFNQKGVVQPKESSFDLITIDDSVKEDADAKAILDQYKADIQDLKRKSRVYRCPLRWTTRACPCEGNEPWELYC